MRLTTGILPPDPSDEGTSREKKKKDTKNKASKSHAKSPRICAFKCLSKKIYLRSFLSFVTTTYVPEAGKKVTQSSGRPEGTLVVVVYGDEGKSKDIPIVGVTEEHFQPGTTDEFEVRCSGFPPHLENLEKQGRTWKTWKNRGIFG